MGWFLDLFGFSQEGDRPVFEAVDEKGTQGPAIDINFNLRSTWQRRAYNFFRAIGYDFWKPGVPTYAALDGRTAGAGDHGPVTSYGAKGAPEERPAPAPPVPPQAAPAPAPAGGGLPGYAVDLWRKARESWRTRNYEHDFVNELFPDFRARPAYACAA